jgi:glycogen synthase
MPPENSNPGYGHAVKDSRGLAAADFVVAPTRAMLLALKKHYATSGPAGVVPNGCDAPLFRPAPKAPIILTAGRLWDEAKNPGALQAIAHRLPWPVYAAGADRHPEGGKRANTSSVRLLGHLARRELAHWYSIAAVYALPARYEPFGLTVLEAALCGCALVLGDIPSLRETWGGDARFHPLFASKPGS